jgi:hypothetical protein
MPARKIRWTPARQGVQQAAQHAGLSCSKHSISQLSVCFSPETDQRPATVLSAAAAAVVLCWRSALKKTDGTFAPAHILADGRLERAGRATQKVQHTLGTQDYDPAETDSSSASSKADSSVHQQQQQQQARAHL